MIPVIFLLSCLRQTPALRMRLFPALLTSNMLVVSLAAAEEQDEGTTSSDASGDVVITEKARAHFKAGVNLMQDPEGERFEEAYQQFKAAYEESASWKILGNLGLTAMRLERYGEAIDAFTEYLKGGKETLSQEEIDQFQRDLETLEASVSTMMIKAPPGTSLTDLRKSTRGEDVKNYYVVPESGELALRVRPGEHEVTAESGGNVLGTWSVRSHSLKTLEHSFEPKALAVDESDAAAAPETDATGQSHKTNRIPAYVAFGLGGVGAVAGGVFAIVHGTQAKEAQGLYDGCRESGTCGSSERTSVEKHDKNATNAGTISLISFGVGAVGIGAGVALWVLGNPAPKGTLEAEVGKLKISPYVTGNDLGVLGTF